MKKVRSFLYVFVLLGMLIVPFNVSKNIVESNIVYADEITNSSKLASLSIKKLDSYSVEPTGFENNLSPAFNSDTTTYTLSLPTDVIDVNIVAETISEGATVTVTGNKYMKNTTGDIIITVSNTEADAPTTYTIHYTKDIEDSLAGSAQIFEYTGTAQKFTTTATAAWYKIELWGAQGGHINRTNLNGGAYTSGEILLPAGVDLYFFVGQGGSASTDGTYNGGGAGAPGSSSNPGFSGGGATDVRLYVNDNQDWYNNKSLASRIMVAGAGGGPSRSSSYDSGNGKSAAGGLVGYDGGYHAGYTFEDQNGKGGLQTAGGAAGNNILGATGTINPGSFGKGGDAYAESYSGSGGGGGGYYGGGAGGATGEEGAGNGAGGGSSFISGHAGSVAITAENDFTPRTVVVDGDEVSCTDGTTDVRCSYHYSGYKFVNTTMIDGQGYNWTTTKGENIGTPKKTGSGTTNGNVATNADGLVAADGYAKLTYMSVPSDDAYLTNLTSNVGTWDKAFNPLEDTYYVTLSAYTTKYTLSGVTSDPYAIATLPAEYRINLGETLRNQIFVTSPSGNQKTYYVIVTRSESELTTSSTKLKSLRIDNGNYDIDFEPLVYEYNLDIAKNAMELNIDGLTFDAGATVRVENNEYITNTTGTVKITVSKDGLADTIYRIHYTKSLEDATLNAYKNDYNYTGQPQTFTATYSGEYKIELWGGAGNKEAYGAYTAGTISLIQGETLYVYVGNRAIGVTNTTIFNAGTSDQSGWNGGGATDIRLDQGTGWNDFNSLKTRIMVAAGGGASNNSDDAEPGAAGGLNGYDGAGSGAGSQTDTPTGSYTPSRFGVANGGCTGGNGYFPGDGSACATGAGGGSSFISGHTGSIAISEDSTANLIIPTASSIHYSGKKFTNTVMVDGKGYSWTTERTSKTGMPSIDEDSIVFGNNSEGHARITPIYVSNDNYLSAITPNIGTISPAFSETVYEYNLVIDKYEQKVTIAATPSDANAVVTGTGEYTLRSGETKRVTITVTSPSGKTKNYVVNITRATLAAGEHNTKLVDLSVDGYRLDIPFTSLTYNYNIEMSQNVYDLNIIATPYDNTATITITGDKYIISDYNKVTIKVEAEGCEPTYYYIYYTKVDYEGAAELYRYTGEYDIFVAPFDKTYLVELWGASGGGYSGTIGYGGYTAGEIYLKAGTTLYVYVGQSGKGMNSNGGATWNGGGGLTSYYGDGNNGSGGGATDIRLVPTSGYNIWNEFDSLKSRIMVAGAGAGYVSSSTGFAGGLSSYRATHTYSGSTWVGTPATQTSGNALGRGADSPRAGGGGGYFGGLTSERAGSGGSSYISGHMGAVALDETSTSAKLVFNKDYDGTTCATGNIYLPCSYHYSGYIFENTVMIDGAGKGWTNVVGTQEYMPDPNGGYYAANKGHSGNGYARITIPDVKSQNDYLDDLKFRKYDYTEENLVDFGFDPTSFVYSVTLDKYTRTFSLEGEVSDPLARVTGLGKYTIEPGETKTIVITVTAEDGNFNTYTITVNRENLGEDEHTNLLKNLQVDKYNLNEDFYSQKYNYTVNVYDTEIDLVINASPLDQDGEASYTVSGNSYISANTGTITVKVTHATLSPVTYTITYTKVTPTMEKQIFNYTGEYQKWTTPFSAKYLIEAWGAAGGGPVVNAHTSTGSAGMGGYAGATFKILENTDLYIYVGGKGTYGAGSNSYGGPVGGWNGGGAGGNSSSGSGGGATDVRLTPTSAKNIWNEANSLYSRFIVAAGGGGTDDSGGTYGSTNDGCGGSGGGLKGQGACYNGVITASYGGTQTEGYALGQGASATVNTDTGGAGGGYYGGLATNYGNGGGGAGSSYIKNYPEADTTYLEYQEGVRYVNGEFKSAQNTGNGYVNITFQGIISDNVYLRDLTVTTDLDHESLIDEVFNPLQKDYTVYLDKYTELFFVEGTLDDQNSTVTGLGEYRIGVGETRFIDVTVTAETGKTKTYTIKVTRDGFEEGEHSTKLVSLHEATYNLRENFYSEKYDYRINVYGNEIDTDWSYTTYDPDAIVTITGDKYIKTGFGVITITVSLPDEVVAEAIADGVDPDDESITPTTYEITYTKVQTDEASKNDYLKTLVSSAGDLSPDFNSLINRYSLHLTSTQTGTKFTGKVDDNKALVTGLDKFYALEPNTTRTVTITVTSDYGTTRDYTIDIARDAYDYSTPSTKLKSLVINEYETDIDFQSDINEYTLQLPKGEIDLTVIGIPYDDDAVVTVEGSKHLDSDIGTITVMVTKDGIEPTTYIIRYKKYDDYTLEYSYSGDYIKFTAPYSGKYTFELWGAQGGRSTTDGSYTGTYSRLGGAGGYTKGTLTLAKDTTFYIYVGGYGQDAVVRGDAQGGWNGGGNATWDHSDDETAGAGGGATDIRIVPGEWNYGKSLASRIMVAAGGGGAAYNQTGGYAGGLKGEKAYYGGEATQTSGYAFGYAQDGIFVNSNVEVAGGGAGYYGGYAVSSGANNTYQAAGGGGSSYISGYTGSIAITSITDTTPRLDSNNEACINGTTDIVCSYHYSNYIFSNPIMIGGNGEQPTYDGAHTQTGNSGNGYAKVSMELSQDAYLNDLRTDYGSWSEEFDPLITSYDITLSQYQAYLNLTGTLSNPNSTVTGLDRMYEFDLGEQKIIPVIVTAPNGDIKTYTLTIHRDNYTDEHSSKLQLLSVVGYEEGYLTPKFTPVENDYTVTIDSSEAEIHVDYIKFDEAATVTIIGAGRIINETGVITVRVSAPGVADTTYTVTYSLESIPEGTAYNFPYTGTYQKFIVPTTGIYQLEVWGSQGGGRDANTFNNSNLGYGGNGGYSTGEIKLYKDQILYVYVGGRGTPANTGIAPGGFNGGGTAWASDSGEPAAGGGGATDIRTELNNLYSRFIVAGGGGGGGEDAEAGGIGGGTTGGNGGADCYGTQTAGRCGAAFGIGASTPYDGGAGGGGWYGGGANGGTQTIPTANSSSDTSGGSGGSGFVYTADTASNVPSGYRLDSKWYLSNARTVAGNAVMPTTDHFTIMYGKTGDGYSVITLKETVSRNNYLVNLSTDYGTITPAFDSETQTYNLTLDAYSPRFTLSAKASDSEAIITGTGTYTYEPGQTGTINIVVTASAGDIRTYKVNVSRAEFTDTHSSLLSDLKINNGLENETVPKFNSKVYDYDLSLYYSVADLNINATAYDEDAVITITGNHHLSDEGLVIITVKCPNLEAKEYRIHYTRDKSLTNYVPTENDVVTTFDYTGAYQTFIAPNNGDYIVELWGAQGNDANNGRSTGGKGAYTYGILSLNKNEKLFVYVGQNHHTASTASFNAGTTGGNSSDTTNGGSTNGFGGGGATDVRLVAGDWNNLASLKSRIMVAAGGGGASNYAYPADGGAAGGLIGYTGANGKYPTTGVPNTPPTGGTQTSGGTGTIISASGTAGTAGGFGTGGNSGANWGSGGGGGYWNGGGGGHTSNSVDSGAGGSSYISGYKGSVAILSADSTSPKLDQAGATCLNGTEDITCSYHYSGKVFTETKMLSGKDIIPNKTGTGTTNGNAGSGYAKITQILKNEDNYLQTLVSSYGVLKQKDNSALGFDPLVTEYTLTLDQYDTSFTLDGTVSQPDAIVSGLGYYEIELGDSYDIEVVVTSESGAIKVYTITATRNPFTDEHSTKLQSLRLLDSEAINEPYGLNEEFNSNKYRYTANLYSNVIDLTVLAVTYDPAAEVEILNNLYMTESDGTVTIRVYIPDSDVDDTYYYIVYHKELVEGADIIQNYSYTGQYKEFTALVTGKYKIQLWGASGGIGRTNSSLTNMAGRGAYTEGIVKLNQGTKLYVFVGQKGYNGRDNCRYCGGNGGWNGGAKGGDDSNHDGDPDEAGGGGGATDIRLVPTSALTTWNETASLASRIMVAGGGSGSTYGRIGFPGGGWQFNNSSYAWNFGYGRSGYAATSGSEGGGGGYWGGNSSQCDGCEGYGGSSYISGHTGQIAITSPTDLSARLDSNGNMCTLGTTDQLCSVHYSGYVFTNTVMASGDEVMPNTAGTGTMTGNQAANGYAIITPLFYSRDYYLTDITATTTLENTMFPVFDPLTNTYSITMDKYDEWITLDATLSDPTYSTITGLGEYRLPNPGDNIDVPLIITARSGEQKIYTVHIRRNTFEIEHTTKLQDLDIIGSEDSINPRFHSLNTVYDIPLSSGVIDVAISAIPYDVNAIITYSTEEEVNKIEDNRIYYLKDDIGTIKVTVSLPDELVDESKPDTQPTTYIIRYNKNASYNGGIGYTGSYTKWVAPTTGYYLFELWGASGGYDRQNNSLVAIGGLGAYTSGKIYLERGTTFYIYVGGAGGNAVKSGYAAGGYNGGGRGDYDHSDDDAAGGGGGATDVRTYISEDGLWSDFDSLKSRIMVAAGGGGMPAWSSTPAGGGLYAYGSGDGAAGTQTSGYAFGYGAPGTYRASNTDESGGGGGYYGGGVTSGTSRRQGAGSSFISGHEGVNAIAAESTSTEIIHTDQPNHYSGYIFTETKMIDGYGYNWTTERENYVGMPNTAGTGTQTGQTGNGYGKITSLEQDNYLLDITVKINKKFKTDEWDNVEGAVYSPEFDKFTNTYTLELPDHVTALTLGARASSDNAVVSGLGEKEVFAGENVYPIKVTAQSGEVKTYTLIVTRESSHESRATQIDVTGFVETLCKPYEASGYCKISPATYDPDTTDYYVTIPSGIRDLEWTVTKMHEYQNIKGAGVTRLGPWMNLITIEVDSELCADYERKGDTEAYRDCMDNTYYTYHVNRDMTGDNYIDELIIHDPVLSKDEFDFDYLLTEYTFRIPNSYTELDMEVILDDPNATYEVIGNENFEVGSNIVEIIVTAANGEVRTYVLNVYRLENGNKKLSELHVKNGTTEYTLNPAFNDITTSYTLDVPNDVKNVNITATASTSTTVISGTGTYNLNTGLNQIHVITTAQNGDTETYTIVINRAKSDNAYLKVLQPLNGSFNETYVKTNNNYTMTVDPYTKKLTLNVITDEENATYRITGNENFKIGNNTVKIQVTAENGNKNTYTITVNKLGSNINTLDTLTTSQGDLSPVFTPAHNSYTITVPNNITSIRIIGTMTDTLSKVTGLDTYRLTTGNNTIEVTVTSETGISNTYTITVFRQYNSNHYLRNLTVSTGTLTPIFDRETRGYQVNVPNDVERITITGYPEVSTTSVIGNGTYDLITGSNTFQIRATAEDSTHMDYFVTVIRDKSSNTNLSNLMIKEARIRPEFNPMVIEYNARVLHDVEDVTVVAIPQDSNSTVTITGNTGLSYGDNTITVTVTAPDESSKDYVITLRRLTEGESPADLFLSSLNISNCELDFVKTTYSYRCDVANEITDVAIEAEAENNSYYVLGTGNFSLKTGDNYKQVVVSDGDLERVYTININRHKSTEDRLQNITINDHEYEPEFSPDLYEYYVETKEYELEFEFIKKHSGQKIVINGNDNMAVGDNTIEIVVTSEDGEHTKTYTFHVTRIVRDDNFLSNLWVEGYEITPEFNNLITNYKVNVPYETTGVIVGATAQDRNATIEGTGLKTLIPSPNTATIRVRAEDGSTKEYRVIITRAASPNNYLESLTIEGETYTPAFDKERLNYSLTVPYETDSINIAATPEDPEASIIGDGRVELKQGVNNVEVYVVAPNGAVRTYVIKVTRKDPITALLLNVEVENYTLDPVFDPYTDLYQVTVDYETTKLNFIITKMDPYSTYEIVGNRNFKIGINEVYINVTSSNRIDTHQYKIIVNRQSYSNTFLSSLTVNQGELTPTFNKSTLTYTVEVANGIDRIIVDGSPDYPLSTISGLGEYNLNVGTNQIHIVVTSPSGIKRTYNVIVNRKKSSNAEVEYIRANIGTLTKDDDYTYTLIVPKYTKNIGKANFTVKTIDSTATVSMPVTIDLTRTTAYPIKVTSPDGTRTKEYTVNVVFDLSHDNTLASLTPSVGELNPKFEPTHNNYRIDLFDDEEEEFFDLYLNEVESTLLNRSLTYQLTELETTAEIMVQAEDGNIRTYTVLIAKSKTKEKYVDNITVTGIDDDLGVTIPSFRSKTYEYEFEVPYEVESVGFDVTKRHPAQQVKVYNGDTLLTGDSYALSLGVNHLTVKIINSLDEVTEYNYTITRLPSTNAHLKSIKLTNIQGLTGTDIINIDAFERDIFEYDIIIPYDNESVTIEAIPEVAGSRIATNGTNNIMEGEERDVKITVTAPDNITKLTYTLNILREPEFNNLLKTLTISSGKIYTLNPKFRPGNTDYRLTVSSTTSSLHVDAIPMDDEITTVSGDIGTVDLSIGTQELKIYSIATVEGREYRRTYKVNVFRPSTNDALLESLVVHNGIMVEPFTSSLEDYTVKVDNDVTALQLTAIPEDSNATVTITGNSDLGYGKENLVTIKVTAADGSTAKYYRLHVSVKGEANPYLSALEVNSEAVPNFNKYIEEYNITVENSVTEINILGTPESANSTVTKGNGNHALAVGENTFDIEVTAQDGETKKIYTINVTRENNAYLQSIVYTLYAEGDPEGRSSVISPFDRETYEYNLLVENDIERINIIGIQSGDGATISGQGPYNLKVGNNPIYLTVRNGDTRKVYVVNVERKGSSNTNLEYLTSTDGELEPLFTNDNDYYEMHLPNYKTKLVLAYKPEYNATVTVADNELSGEESTVHVIVTAEDGSTRIINIKVYLEDGGYFNSRLASLEVQEGTISPKFDPDEHEYTLTVSQDVTVAHINAIPEESTSTITGNGAFDLELGKNQTSIIVTALDGSQTTYNLSIFRKDMDNADLTGLYTDIGELDPEFSPKQYTYTIDVPEETRKVHLTAVAYSEKRIEGDGDVYLGKGVTTRNIVVTSESGIVNTYVVRINRALSTNHDITNITESTGQMSPVYNASTLNYSFTVGDVKPNLDKTYVVTNHVTFDVTTYSELAEVIYEKVVTTKDEDGNPVTDRITLSNNDVQLDYGNNRIIIYAMSEDGNTSSEYVFDIYRIHDLTNITVPGDATGPAMLDGSPNHISVQPGGTFDLLSEITYTPEDADFKDLIFRSNNTSLVTVDENGIITAADVLDKSTTITVTSKYYPNIVKTVNVTVEITLITSEVYDIQREHTGFNPYVTYIDLKTSIQTFLDNLDNDNRFLHVYDIDGTKITDYTRSVGTGMRVQLENNGHVYDGLDIAVIGDLTGEGLSNALDLNAVQNHLLLRDNITGIKFIAADTDKNGLINALDLNDFQNYLLLKSTRYLK